MQIFKSTAFTWLSSRLRERSTWLGIMAVLAGVGITLNPELQEAIVGLGAALGGLVAVISKDK